MVLKIIEDWIAITQYLNSIGLLLVITITWIIITKKFSANKRSSNGKPIPGSIGWPILGHLPYINQANPYPLMAYYTNKYGHIFRLQMGSWKVVVITDFHAIKKAFNHPDMTRRPKILGFELSSYDFHGLVVSSGPLWQEQRRFALRQLRDLGMGKSSIESHIQREIAVVIDGIKVNLGKPVDLNTNINIGITNIVWAIVTGKRLEYDDPKFIKMVTDMNRRIELLFRLGPVSFIPWLSRVFPDRLTGLDVIKKEMDSFMDYLEEVVDEHRVTFDPNDPRDYIDHFLIEQLMNPNSSFTDMQLKVSISDLFGAGGDTTATTLRWAFLLISQHPEVMRKLQEEIDRVVGRDRLPSLEDQNRMPYAVAVINEVQRFSDIVPLSLRFSERDILFEGFHIPQDTIVIGFYGHSHRNKKYWTKPYDFYPEHFLEPNGELRKNVEGFFPFSTGKRICLGERLARAELFLFMTHFYQQFNIDIVQMPTPTLDADPIRSGMIRCPSSYTSIITQRH